MTLRVAELETLFTANVADFDKGAAKVDAKTKTLAKSDPVVTVKADTKSATADMDKVAAAAKKLHTDSMAAMTDVGQVGVAVGVAAAAGVGLAVSKFVEFDKAMSQAQAGTMATGAALDSLRAAAIAQGAATQYSASEAANAITEMGKAGVSTADILGGGLAGALALAASGQIAVGRAGEIAATAMNQFGLTGKELPHVADLMAAAAGKAQGGVEDIANAMKYVGPVAKNLNVSIEETTGVIAELASQGIIGEQAGTSLRGMLLSLTSPSKIAASTMSDLGINVYDTSGKFIGMSGVAGVLQARLGTLDDATRNEALGRIFGNEQITAATILYKGGSRAVEDWTAKVNDSGFAARQAAMLTDNLSGDMERLGGSLDTALIQTGSGANAVLRTMAQNAEGVVNIIGALPPAALTTGLAVMTAVAAVGLLGGGLLLLAPKIMATKEALDVLATSHKTTAGVVKGVGIAAGIATGALAIGAIGLSIWAANAGEARQKTDALAQTLDKATGAVTDLTRENVKAELAQKKTWLWFLDAGDSAYNNAKKLGISLNLVTEAAMGNATALAQVNDAMNVGELGSATFEAALKKSGLPLSDFTMAQGQLKDSLKGSNDTLDDAMKITKQKAEADAKAAKDADGFTSSVDFTTKAVDRQIISLGDLLSAQKDAAGIQMTAAQAEAAWAQQTMDNTAALKDLGVATKDGGASFDLYSEAGQTASQALTDTSSAAWAMIDAAQKGGAGTDELRQKTADARAEFITTATQMGLTEAAASALADQYGLIPSKIQTTAELLKAQAEADLDALAEKVRGLPGGVVSIETVGYTQTYAYLTQTQDLMNKINGTHVRIAMGAGSQGGMTFGDGGYTGNGGVKEPAGIVHGKEFVVNAAGTARNRSILEAMNRGVPGYASGGYVTSQRVKETDNRFGLTVPVSNTTVRADERSSTQSVPASSPGMQFGDVTLVAADPRAALNEFRNMLRFEMAGRF
jgi:TP901 family phage tail tape measure protein